MFLYGRSYVEDFFNILQILVLLVEKLHWRLIMCTMVSGTLEIVLCMIKKFIKVFEIYDLVDRISKFENLKKQPKTFSGTLHTTRICKRVEAKDKKL